MRDDNSLMSADTVAGGVLDVAGRPDEVTEAMVVGVPQASLGNHAAIIGLAARSTKQEQRTANSPFRLGSGDNPRRKVLKPVANSTGKSRWSSTPQNMPWPEHATRRLGALRSG
jgi:hypothetical protein